MQTEINHYKTRIIHAVLLLMLGFLGFSVADLCAKLLQDYYKTTQVLFISGFIGVVINGAWLFLSYGAKAFIPSNLPLHLLRAAIICGTAFCMVSALKTLPLADFYGVSFLSPFMLLILSVIFLKETVGWRRWLAVAVAFSGIFILAGPQFDHVGTGIAFALGGALCAASSVIALRKIGHGSPLPLYGFYPSLFIAATHGTAMIIQGDFLTIRMEDFPVFAVHGPAAIVGIIATSMGYAKSPEASIVAPFMYTQIIWGILFGWFVFHVVPTETTAIGLTLIIAAGCYSIWRDYRKKHEHMPVVPETL
jgi:drug/metabolite transporter (DMT)-like permease